MLSLSVTHFNGTPLPAPIRAIFDETGGAIGRAENNVLVLPDPDRTISRIHARVVFRTGAYALVDEGSNPVVINGQALGKGREAPLRPGDRLQIGGYVIEVAAGGAAAEPIDPFADFLGLAVSAPTSAPANLAASAPAYSAARNADPLGLGFGAPAASPAAVAGGIPDDWDPFAPTPVTEPGVRSLKSSAGASALGLDLGMGAPTPLVPGMAPASGGGDSLDLLFGLGAPGPSSGALNPLANSRLDAPVAQPNLAGHADPLRSLSALPAAGSDTRADDSSELNRAFSLPPITMVAPVQPPPPISPPAATPAAPVLSWDAGASGVRTMIRPSAAAPASLPMPPPPAPRSTAALSAQTSADVAALLAAFQQGLGQPELKLPALDPAFMQLLGELLREATQGTVDLLVARAAVKRVVRAQATMIVARENNPLKFSPSGEAALAHLLGPQVRGFMPAQKAMRDALDDLRAHQIAFLAGMRAALEGLLGRFDPAMLESRLTQKSVLSSLMPGARKAQLWGVFQQEYAQIAKEASDDFQQLFGREFLKAYEAQLDQLKS